MSTVAEMAEIRKIEAEAAGPHDLGCFETYADIEAEALHIDGDYDEILDDGRTLMAHFHTDLAADPARCACWVEEAQDEE
jgi:hypothetical protein